MHSMALNTADHLNEQLTVVITSSPVPSHPSDQLLEVVLRSFSLVPGLCGCRTLVVCDGCRAHAAGARPRPRQGVYAPDAVERYEAYKHAITEKSAAGVSPYNNVEVLALPSRHGFAFAIQAALEHVATPTVMIVHHDQRFIRPINVHAMARLLTGATGGGASGYKYFGLPSSGTAKYIAQALGKHGIDVGTFACSLGPLLTREVAAGACSPADHVGASVGAGANAATAGSIRADTAVAATRATGGTGDMSSASVGAERAEGDGACVPRPRLLPLLSWYDRTHVVLTEHYRSVLSAGGARKGSFMEDSVGQRQLAQLKRDGMASHAAFGTWLWDDSDDASIYHINGQNFLTPEERVSRGLPPLPPEQAQAQFGSGEWRRSQAAANDTNASASS